MGTRGVVLDTLRSCRQASSVINTSIVCLLQVYTGGSGGMEDDRCTLLWKKEEDVKKWILRVETYAAAHGWNNNKMAAMAAIGLPDDKVEFLF